MTPNRITAAGVALLGAALALAGLVAPLGAPAQVAALVAGAVTVLTPAVVWLRGWQAYEARQGEADQPVSLDDVREQLARLAASPPEAAVEALQSSVPEYVATQMIEALQASVPSSWAAAPAPVVDPATGPSGYVARPAGDDEPDELGGVVVPEPVAEAQLQEVAGAHPEPGALLIHEPPDLPPDERGAP